MALLDAPDFYGYTMFCDDIRMEADRKAMFIGVYAGHMFVHANFPVTLPKFGLGITFIQKKKLFDPKLGIRVFLPHDSDDNASIQADMADVADTTIADSTKAAGLESLADDSVISLQANLILAPFTILQPGLVKVRVLRQNDLVRLGTLTIHQGQPPSLAPA
jgi:hypothetical protein